MKRSEAQKLAWSLGLTIRDVRYLTLKPDRIVATLVQRTPEGRLIRNRERDGVLEYEQVIPYEPEET